MSNRTEVIFGKLSIFILKSQIVTSVKKKMKQKASRGFSTQGEVGKE